MNVRHIVLIGLCMLVIACDPHADSTDGGLAAPLSFTTEVRPTTDACSTPSETPLLRDAAGAAWWSERDRWCRAATRNRPAQAWTNAPGKPATRRLVMEGRHVALIERQIRLAAIFGTPTPPPFGACGSDVRSRAFAAQNRLQRSGDLVCGRPFKGPGFVLTTAGFRTANGTVPTLVATPTRKSAGTILYLFGGPYESFPPGLVTGATINHLLARWAARATLVIPSYLGIDPVRIDDGDATLARAEADALIIALKRRGPVCVIGFSMGVAIAAPAVANHPDTRFLFAAPLATAPATFVARAAAQGRKARPIPLTPAVQGDPALTLPSDQAFLRYFAGTEHRDLAGLLGPGPHANLRIAHAAGDIPALRSDLAKVAPMLPVNAIRELPASVGHSIEAPFAASVYRPLIDGFLAECLRSV